MNVQPGVRYEAVIETGQTGLLGTIGVTVNDNQGATTTAYTGAAQELAPGVYSAPSLTAPTVPGQYTLIWTLGAGGTVLGTEDLVVGVEAVAPIGAPSPIGPGMSGSALITEFLADKRFGTSRTRILGFLNYRYGELLGLEEWAFLQGKTGIALDSAAVAAPADCGLPWRLYLNDDGDPLDFLNLADFQDQFVGDTMSGRPAAWTVFAGTLLIGPAPDASYPATLLYQIQPPPLADDAVPPVTPPETHLALVAGAQAFALELENDPTGGPLEARYQRTIDGMRRRYLVAGRGMSDQLPRDALAYR